ncbi:MAG: hypothetical protein IPJ69_03135 [Deltaproteobacteria bacterium]|nr:MAG: hypothetical protein IPJ69_03135 [Deltaproteobacteria bacterium]
MIPIQQIDDCFIKIGTPSSNRINFTINYHEKVFFSDEFISPTPTISFDYVFPWLFNGMKKVLDLPHDVITRLQMEGNQDFHKDLIEVIKIQINMLFETKNCIKKYEYLREKISKHTGKLFLNLGETPMISEIYQEAVKQDPKHVFYDSCHFLNDYFRHKETTLPTLENLTEEILSKEIKTIFVHNSLYLRFFSIITKFFYPPF